MYDSPAPSEATNTAIEGQVHHELGWISSTQGHLYVSMHSPLNSKLSGAIVLVPPLGTERVYSQRSMNYLGTILASTGIAVARVDMPGTGDSENLSDAAPDPRDWVQATVDTAQHLYAAGVPQIGFAGLRIGALIAAAAARQWDNPNSLILWDPISHARHHMRSRSALLSISTGFPSGDEDYIHIPGASIPRSTVRAFNKMSLDAPGIPTVVLERTEEHIGPGEDVRSSLDPDSETTHFVSLRYPNATVSPEQFVSAIPGPELKSAASRVSAYFNGPRQSVTVPLESSFVGTTSSGHQYRERVDRVGPNSVLTITTEPVRTDRDFSTNTGQAALLTSAANDPHHGPHSLWVHIARQLAISGASAVRWDRTGVGDSGPVSFGEFTPLYSDDRYIDLEAVLHSIDAADEDISLIGACSGGWTSCVAALAHPRMRVLYVAPQDWLLKKPEFRADQLTARGWDLESASPPPRPTSGLALTVYNWLYTSSPYLLWVFFSRFGIAQIPGRMLIPLAELNVSLTLAFPPGDWTRFTQDHGMRGLRAARRKNWDCTIVHLADTADDHALWAPAYLDQVIELAKKTVFEKPRRYENELPPRVGLTYPGGRVHPTARR